MKKNIRRKDSVVRKLTVRGETVKQLTAEQLDVVVGGLTGTDRGSGIKTICNTSAEGC